MKVIGGIMFVVGVLLTVALSMTKYSSTDAVIAGVGLMAGGILVGYLGSKRKGN